MNLFIETIRRLLFWPPAYPQTIQIGLTNVCNFNCPMCQRFDLGVAIKHLELERIKAIIEKIDVRLCPNLVLTGWGEPLCYPQLIEILSLAKAKGFQVRLTTNGNLLDEEKILALLTNCRAITFSIDQLDQASDSIGHPIKEQLSKIEQLLKNRQELGAKTAVYLQTTFGQGAENKILLIIDYADKMGIDRVRISRLDIRFQKLDRPTPEQEKAFVRLISDYIKNKKVAVDFSPYLAFDGVARYIYRFLAKYLHAQGKYCLRTFSDLYINENGQATPCCALPKYVIGDALSQSIDEIWNSDKMKKFRQQQKIVCGACDVLEINYKG